jgi:8-oxo-dGTP pyrophosphatase MutT (NUDIX family)
VTQARFIAFHERPERAPLSGPAPRFAVMIARAGAGVLLVHSRVRRVWELPGGLIDTGETPRQAAVRELHEESGCIAQDTRWLGIVEAEHDGWQSGAVLACRVDPVPRAFSNEETMALGYWTPHSWPAPLAQCDEELLRRLG